MGAMPDVEVADKGKREMPLMEDTEFILKARQGEEEVSETREIKILEDESPAALKEKKRIATEAEAARFLNSGHPTIVILEARAEEAARAPLPESDAVAVILIAPQTWSPEQEAQGYRNRYGKDLSTVLGQARALVADGKGDTLMDPVDFIYCEKTRATADAFVAYYGPDEDMDTPRLIPRIQAPVVVFAGSEDRVVAGLVEKTEPLADGQKVRLVVIDGADHFFRDLYSEDIADAVAPMIEVE